ncbi:MAG: hypothetical protein R2754_12810 [Microthrixaceae bacterium]
MSGGPSDNSGQQDLFAAEPAERPTAEAQAPTEVRWDGQWLQAAAEQLGLSPRTMNAARNRHGDATPEDATTLSIEPGRLVAHDADTDRRTSVEVRRWGPVRWGRAKAALGEDAEVNRALSGGKAHPRCRRVLMAAKADPMPAAGDLAAECGCGRPACSHLAELLVAAAAEIADDPFVLLVLRGVDRTELGAATLDETPPGWPRAMDPGVAPEAAWKRSPPEPAAITHRPTAERPRPEAAPADSGLTRAGLGALADLAAHRARALLARSGPEADGGLGVLAERLVERGVSASTVARRSGLSADELEVRRQARVLAGEDGVAVLLDRFDADPDDLDEGAAALGGRVRLRANLVTSPSSGRQLRIDRQGRWWMLRADPQLGWVVTAGPSGDATTLCGQPAGHGHPT